MKASTILAVVATAVLSYASPVPEEQSEQSAQGGYPGGPSPPGFGGPAPFGPQAAGYGGGGLCTSAQPFTGTCIGGSGFIPALPPPIAGPIGPPPPPPCGGPSCGGGFFPPPPPPCGGPSCGGFIPPPPAPIPQQQPAPFAPSCSNTEANACCNNSGSGGGLLGALPFGGGCSDLSLFGDGECGDSQIACCATTNVGNSGFSVINIGSLCQLVTL
ncbi:hypothetical protein Slin15195_G126210 [Septoria linicola]|uniref:Hydrophobin n=1 Tax=Septoria linicola TaxID=215465 RepID=A0A9Q9B084_9PEZI|nr:hypothetical protein Slin14017_G082390 [Septoria linicola]USW59302.1 hypothetical protein Slin15195_G126210 [Septoria linicola]